MRKALISAATVAAAAVAGTNAIAQNVAMPEVIVETHRTVETMIGKTSSGIPIKDVSMGYTVTAKGLDLSTPQGSRAFEARIRDAASAACEELGRRYQNSSTTDQECVTQATDKAMAQARQLEDAAVKNRSR